MHKTTQKENKVSGQIIGFLNLNQGTDEDASKEKKTFNLGAVKAGQEFKTKTEESIRKSEQEKVVFAERIQNQTLEESAEDNALKAKKWEYVRLFPTMAWSEADKKRIFNNKQICLDGDGSDVLTEEQIAFLKDKYDIRHLTAEDTYYLMCDLTAMNVFSSEEWASMICSMDDITLLPEDIDNVSGRVKDEGRWGWMWDEESGCNILVYSRSFYQEEEEEEDPEAIKARIKGQLDDVLLAAFDPESKREALSPEEFQSEQILKENAEGITGELEAKLMSGRKITEQEVYNGGANSGALLDIAILRWNMAAEIKGLTQAASQIPDTAAKLLAQYQKKFDASDKFLKIVDQIKR